MKGHSFPSLMIQGERRCGGRTVCSMLYRHDIITVKFTGVSWYLFVFYLWHVICVGLAHTWGETPFELVGLAVGLFLGVEDKLHRIR